MVSGRFGEEKHLQAVTEIFRLLLEFTPQRVCFSESLH